MVSAYDRDGGSLPTLRSSVLDGARHGFSTRQGGVSTGQYSSLNLGLSTGDAEDAVVENRVRFFASVGADPQATVYGRLTHGNAVAVFERREPERWPVEFASIREGSLRRERTFRMDAAISNVPGLTIFMTFADCVPLLVHDPVEGVVGMAHAGWRGTALDIGPQVVAALQSAFGSQPSNVRVAIGPSIGPCCYSVSDDVWRRFEETGVEPVRGSGRLWRHLDLWETNRRALRRCGVREDHIDPLQSCTGCDTERFYSHRIEQGKTGRLGACIGLDGVS